MVCKQRSVIGKDQNKRNKTHDVQQMCIILLFSFPKFGLHQQGSLPYVRYGKLLKTHPDDRGLSPPHAHSPPMTVAEVTLPSGLRTLTFGKGFNQALDNGQRSCLPDGLQHLHLGDDFNMSLPKRRRLAS